MKAFLFTCAVLLGIAGTGMHADAQNYPWCANYAMGEDRPTNCGFTTYDQCMATVSGIGGFCERNTQYVPSVAMPSRPRTRPWHYRLNRCSARRLGITSDVADAIINEPDDKRCAEWCRERPAALCRYKLTVKFAAKSRNYPVNIAPELANFLPMVANAIEEKPNHG